MPQPPRHDGWKHTPKPNPAKPAAQHNPNTSRKPWQPGAPKVKSTGIKTSRATKFIAAGVGVGLLTAAVVLVLLWLRPAQYPNIVVVAPDLADSLALPENAAGVAAAKGLEEWADGNRRGHVTGGLAATAADPDAWKAKLNAKTRSTVLYFAAHVGADASGPYLWVAAGGAAKKLPLTEVIDRLGDAELKGKPKLLVIDISESPPNWAFGGAFNDFVQAVKDLDAKIEKVDNLCVLLSADAGQTAWIADEWGKSAFGHYFTEGLREAAGQPGGPVNAADLYGYVKQEVQKWAVANREANQAPVLLPEGSGEARAKNLELITLPRTAEPGPIKRVTPAAPPPELRTEWERAERLAARNPAPDTTDPLKWREYLDCLLRWERLLRVNAEGEGAKAMAARAARLGGGLEPMGGNTTGVGVALPAGSTPAGKALPGVAPVPLSELDFAKLWDPPGGPAERGKEWDELKKKPGQRDDALRLEVCRLVLEKVRQEGVSRATLDTAEAVLAAGAERLSAEEVMPVEAHYLRMLQRHLPGSPKKGEPADAKQLPPPELLLTAITLRQTAERAAWADGLPYPEQTVRWTAVQVETADENRQEGEDLLFDIDPKSRDEAAKLFATATAGYAEAERRAKVVADALAWRDKVFARLPYYARWVASLREGPANANELVALLEQAGKGAHDVDKRITEVSDKPTEADVTALEQAAKEASAIKGVADAYDRFAADPGTQAQASNWHKLQAAQAVPFRKTGPGPDLGEKARGVAITLAGSAEQKTVTRVPDDPSTVLKAAERHLRAAAAHLNDAPPTAGIGTKPVDLADKLAEKLRGLPETAAAAMREAGGKDTLRDGALKYAAANRDARLCDPAAPAGGTPTPPEADRRLWRHFFLLGHAGRIIRDGWCREDETGPKLMVENWYCTKAARLVCDAADAELTKLVPDRDALPPTARGKLVVELNATKALTPTVLEVAAAPTRVIVEDEKQLPYSFSVAARGERVGFPVWEYVLPDPLKAANADKLGRRVLRWPAAGKPGDLATQKDVFNPGSDLKKAAPDPLTADVLYRGRVYQRGTTITFSGPPNLRVEHVPPTGKAVMALEADPEAVTGAVTVLVDVSISMGNKVPNKKPKRIDETLDGLEKFVPQLFPNTQVRIATFVGSLNTKDEFVRTVTPVGDDFLARGGVPKEVMEQLRTKAKQLEKSTITPIAGAIDFALDPRVNTKLWPKQFTGARTLVLITDGEDTWNKYANDTDTKGYKLNNGGPADPMVKPKEIVKQGVKAALPNADAPDVNVYVALFALDPESVETAVDQFKDLEAADALSERAQFQLLRDVNTADDLANRLAEAMMPRVRYQGVRGAKENGQMIASVKNSRSKAYNTTKLLEPGDYDLRGGGYTFPQVHLAKGERALLRAEWDKRAEKVSLTRPPIAYELAKAGRHKNHVPGVNIALTLAELKYTPRGVTSKLETVLTLEDRDPALKTQELRAASRTYAWIDPIDPDGEPVYAHRPKGGKPAGEGPQVLIRNHLEPSAPEWGKPRAGHELLTPAWDVSIEQWDKPDNNDSNAYRLPEFRGYWVTGLPKTVNRQTVSPSEVKTLRAAAFPQKQFSVEGGVVVPVLDAAVEEEKDGRSYLWVWMEYQEPGKLVLLRADRKSTEDRLGEWHAYYDEHRRYTAKFGPLTDDDLKSGLLMELYTVESLRQHARKDKRDVTLNAVPRTTDSYPLDDRLKMAPKTK